jgi:hypothetical protein
MYHTKSRISTASVRKVYGIVGSYGYDKSKMIRTLRAEPCGGWRWTSKMVFLLAIEHGKCSGAPWLAGAKMKFTVEMY